MAHVDGSQSTNMANCSSHRCLLGYLLLHITLLTLLFGCLQALECYACDSAEDVECATRPGQQLEVEECSKANDECVISITAGLTRRGCLGRLYPNGYCAEPCARCNTSLCNRYVYPVERLRCYQCLGSECIDVSKRPQLLLPCPYYKAEDRCYTNIISVQTTRRGCEHTDLPKDCPNVCLKCNYNGCNNELTITESRCLECTHNRNTPNPSCLRQQLESTEQCALSNATTVTQCVNKVMLGHRERCYTHRNAQTEVLQRGCSTNMGFFPTGELSECYGEDCNAQCLDIACASCNSSSNANCRSGQRLNTERCASGTVACYACEQDTQLRRGCADANFAPAAQESCQLCRSADGCNRWSVRSCYHCSSLEAELGNLCAHMAQPEQVPRSNCSSPGELCVSTIINRLDYVYTLRGCAHQVPECTANDPYCVRCNGSLCNDAATIWTAEQMPAATSLSNVANGLFKYFWPAAEQQSEETPQNLP